MDDSKDFEVVKARREAFQQLLDEVLMDIEFDIFVEGKSIRYLTKREVHWLFDRFNIEPASKALRRTWGDGVYVIKPVREGC